MGGVRYRGSDCACMGPHVAYWCAILIGSQRIMFVFMQLRFYRIVGVPNMSQYKRDWWKVRYCRMMMLAVLMLSGRILPRVR